jgi:hypothetical protein
MRSRSLRFWLPAVVGAGVVALALALLLGGSEQGSGRLHVGVYGSMTTLREGTAPSDPGSSGARLMAAGNEFESFQVAIEARRSDVSGVGVEAAGPLLGPGGTRIAASALTVYREGEYQVRTVSDVEGATGPWPDPLIPVRDYFYNELRDGFPYDAPDGGTVVAWVDLLVPQHQAPGEYRGAVRVTAENARTIRVPIRLRVLDFTIPSTSSLQSAFPVSTSTLCEVQSAAGCDATGAGWLPSYLYARAALENRVTVPNAYVAGPSYAPGGPERRLFERFGVPLIQGSPKPPVPSKSCSAEPARGQAGCLTSVRLTGAMLTSVQGIGVTPASPSAPVDYGCAAPARGCIGAWLKLAQRFGFARRFYIYLCDEPAVNEPSGWPDCAHGAALLRRSSWPSVRKSVTTSIGAARANGAVPYTDTMVVDVHSLADRPGRPLAGDQRPAYEKFLSLPGRRLWLYTACDQYDCASGGGDYWKGWPGYGIDQPASQARAVGWLAFEYGATGELYYNAASELATPWTDQYQFGGNGDGTLFYPGLPSGDADTGAPAIGGVHPIPIESMRLKRIRDGREDYEYLRLADERGQGAEARAIVARLLSDGKPGTSATDAATYSTTFTQAELTRARCELARLLEPDLAGC